MTLAQADTGREYVIKDIQGEDEELIRFLFTLGCYTGEPITVIARKRRWSACSTWHDRRLSASD